MPRSLYLLLLLGVGCAPFSTFDPYYENWNPPSISGLSVVSEAGNIGGGTTTINGSGFGEDANQIVVQFGDDNAQIVSITDSAIEVIVPPGPITGGAVDIRVATTTGTGTAVGGYTYDVGTLYAEQIGHIQINNYWESCYGGLSDRLDDAYPGVGCNTISYVGYAGIDGVAESLEFRYPRLHAENIGYFGGTDQGSSEWVVERPGQLGFAFGVEDLHADIGEVVLRNEIWEGDAFCPDLDSLASYRYGGGVEGYLDPVTVAGADYLQGSNCDPGDEGAYPLDELRFCTSPSEDGTSSFVYRPDWPVVKNFFAGKKNDWTKSAEITISAPAVGIDGLLVDVPESLVVYNTEGFEPVLEGETAANDLWSLSTMQGCFDDDGNGERLDDVALRFEWTPSKVSEQDGTFECNSPGELCAQRTYVRLTLTALSLNWFGTVGYPVRATLVVDDEAPRGSDLASLEVPASVMYQIPSVRLPQASGLAGGDGLLDSTISDWGYVVAAFERVTDYAIRTNTGDTVVFSYTTGDFGFFGWDNPTDADGCSNCLDDDDDGWSDADDPDCAGGAEETGFGDDACNDGRDNDGDGREDADDADCLSGDGADESNCSNELDDDADGLADELDPDCLAGGNEGDNACDDGADSDGDGWVDLADPDCSGGDEEVGFGTTACNDGEDNDLDGLADILDPDCLDAADDDEATPVVTPGCEDGTDEDADGWTDAADPDCAGGGDELGFGGTACNDGVDNDGDLSVDAADPDCADASDDDESTPVVVTGCTDGLDGDLDGWTDGADPDCAVGSEELGFGVWACNDGVDNDVDLFIDGLDPECIDALDEDEAL